MRNINNNEIKQDIVNKLFGRNVWTRRVTESEIQTRCPFCGDTQKSLKDGHLYIRINPNDNYPIVYNCFKCPAQGILKYEDLELLGIEDDGYRDKMQSLNKTSDKINQESFSVIDKYFDFKLPVLFSSDSYRDMNKIKYVENRLGIEFTNEDLNRLKIITSLKEFLIINDINYITCKPEIARKIEDHYVGFLNSNNSYILFRDISDTEHIRWFKYYITEECRGQRTLYAIKSEVDLYTSENIIINLSEGIMDAISIAYNIDSNSEYNTINMAVCGKFYVNTLKYLIGLGFVGSNIIVNIYSDNDHTIDTSIDYYRKTLKRFSYLFGEINVYYNTLQKDCGVRKSEILLQKFKI